MKRIGLRFGSIDGKPGAVAFAVEGSKAIAVIDADTGEEITNVFRVRTDHHVRGVITATVSFYVTKQEGVPNDSES